MISKKAMVLSTVLGIILAITTAYFVIKFASGLVSNPTQGTNAFYQMTDFIQNFYDNKNVQQDSTSFYMAKGNYVLAFTKLSDKVEYFISSPDGTSYQDYNFLRPSFCEPGKACMCLCKTSPEFTLLSSEIKCSDDKLICRSFQGLDFEFEPSPWQATDLYVTGSFVYGREAQIGKGPYLPERKLPYSTVTLQKAGNFVGYCENPDPKNGCFAEGAAQKYEWAQEMEDAYTKGLDACQKRKSAGPCICTLFDVDTFLSKENSYLKIQSAQTQIDKKTQNVMRFNLFSEKKASAFASDNLLLQSFDFPGSLCTFTLGGGSVSQVSLLPLNQEIKVTKGDTDSSNEYIVGYNRNALGKLDYTMVVVKAGDNVCFGIKPSGSSGWYVDSSNRATDSSGAVMKSCDETDQEASNLLSQMPTTG